MSSEDIPRICLQLILSEDVANTTLLLYMRHHRGSALPVDAFYGFKDLFVDKESLILETTSPAAMHHYWSLCSQLVPISGRRALVVTQTEAETWTKRMDNVMENDSAETAVKLRWRASKHGGRTFASPTATTKALAASRRRGTAPISTLHFNAEVEILGEVGKEDGQVLALLMQHASRSLGLTIKETDYTRPPKIGEYVHLATLDTTAPPGKLRVCLSSADEVQKLHSALHGQTLLVGNARVGIAVGNDLLDGRQVPGGNLRSWA